MSIRIMPILGVAIIIMPNILMSNTARTTFVK
jgi:hypothetical protein